MTLEEPEAPWRKEEEEGGEQGENRQRAASLPCGGVLSLGGALALGESGGPFNR